MEQSSVYWSHVCAIRKGSRTKEPSGCEINREERMIGVVSGSNRYLGVWKASVIGSVGVGSEGEMSEFLWDIPVLAS